MNILRIWIMRSLIDQIISLIKVINRQNKHFYGNKQLQSPCIKYLFSLYMHYSFNNMHVYIFVMWQMCLLAFQWGTFVHVSFL